MKNINGKKFLSNLKLYSDYLKWRDDLQRYENWDEACEDIINGHKDKHKNIKSELDFCLENMKDMRVLASQRSLQFRKNEINRNNCRMFNCSVLHACSTDIFKNAFYLGLSGCGVGVSLMLPFVNCLPSIKQRKQKTITYVIEDSIEGWCDALDKLLMSFFDGQDRIRFDYSNIRPAGALISGGFKAPGSDGLKKSLEIIENLLNNLIDKGQNKLKPINVFDIICHASDAVLSGGVRRCIGKGSKVLTKEGTYKEIENIQVGDYVKTLKGYKKVTNTFVQGEQETIKLIYQSGELACTPNHKVAVFENEKVIWKQAGELKESDLLVFCLDKDENEFNSNLPKYLYKKPKKSTTGKNITIPDLDSDIAYLIGLIQGDGYVRLTSGSGEISIAIENNLDKVNKVASILKRFDVNVIIQSPTSEDNSFKVRVKSKQLAEYLYKHVKQPKTTLKIPEFILNSSTEIQKSYIAGVFCADGSFKNRPVVACSSIYKEFLKELQCLISKFGIHSRIKDVTFNRNSKWQNLYNLNILGKDNFNNFKNIVQLSPKSHDKNFILKANNSSILPNKDNIQPIKLLEIQSNKKIETFDIEVEDEHCFMCEGILVHNSALNMIVDPNDEEMIYAKIGNWRQENPQRARSNNSVLILRTNDDKKYFEKIVNLNNADNDIGFVFGNTWFDLFNPCFVLDTKILTKDGWRTFKELLQLQEEGKDIYISQDSRVDGFYDGEKEYWKTHLTRKGTKFTKIGKVAKTGDKQDVYNLTLSCGRSVKATGNHKFSTKDGMKNLLDLIPGEDEILIGVNENKTEVVKNNDYKDGFLCGAVIGDGYINEKEAAISIWSEDDDDSFKKLRYDIEEYFCESINNAIEKNKIKSKGIKNLKSDIKFKLQTQVGNQIKYTLGSTGLKRLIEYYKINKNNIDNIHSQSKSFKFGFIAGLFFADGHVETPKNNGFSFRITQSNKELLKTISLVLQEMGIMSSVYNLLPEGKRLLPNSNRELKEYDCKASYRLIIPGLIQAEYFLSILSHCTSKIEKAKEFIAKAQKIKNISTVKRVVSIDYVGKEDVYCLEENTNRTLIANGITAARCFEIGFTPVNTQEDLSNIGYEELEKWTKKNIKLFGVQFCNLNEINAEKCKNKTDFLTACKAASILGTVQASYTNFPYLGKISEDLTKRESLLGVSITGWMNNPKLFNPELLEEGAKLIIDTNKEIAQKIGINQAARTTCVKPSGNSSVVLMTASGIHAEHSENYFRIMQINKTSEVAKFLLENMPELLEESVWSSNNTDYVVFVPISNPKNGLFKNAIKGVKHLELIHMVQKHWVNPGTNKDLGISNKSNHNVSCTCTITNKQEVIDYIWENRTDFTAVSFLSDFGDKDFNQAPFTSVLSVEEIFEKYGRGCLFISGLIVDGLHYFNNNLWEACDCLLNQELEINGTRERVLLKKYWLQRAKKFAKNYFKNDLKELVYCLKDVHLSHKWDAVTRVMKNVDFNEILKKPEYQDISKYAAIACSGGQCELV